MLIFKLSIFVLVYWFQEYVQDGIDWTKVEFEDNQDCLNLFEKVSLITIVCFIFSL